MTWKVVAAGNEHELQQQLDALQTRLRRTDERGEFRRQFRANELPCVLSILGAQECRFLLRSFSPLRRTITGLDASADATAVSKRVSYLWSVCATRARKCQAMELLKTPRTTAN